MEERFEPIRRVVFNVIVQLVFPLTLDIFHKILEFLIPEEYFSFDKSG